MDTMETKEQALFYMLWLKHGRNAKEAYKEFNPQCTSDRSATANGYKMIKKLPKDLVLRSYLQAYGLSEETYFKTMADALTSKQFFNPATRQLETDYKTIKPYHDKLGKLLDLDKEEEKVSQNLNITIVSYERPTVEVVNE